MKLPSIGSYIDESWNLYKDHFAKYAGITFWYVITVIIALGANFLLPTYGGLPFVDNLGSVYTPLSMVGVIVSFVNLIIILPVISLWISIGLIKYMHGASEGKAPSASDAMSDAGRVLLPTIGLTILITLLFLAAFLVPWIPGMIFVIAGMEAGGVIGVIGVILLTLGIIAGLVLLTYFAVRYSFAMYELILGNATISSSLSRSYAMTSSHFWPVFARWLIAALLITIVGVVLNLVSYVPAKAFVDLFLSNLEFFERLSVGIDLMISLILFMIMTPFSTVFGYVLYRHVRK